MSSNMFARDSSLATAVCVFITFYVVAYWRRKNSPFSKIPTVGPSGIITSYLGGLKSFFYGYSMIKEGYKKYRIFKIPRYVSWLVIVNGNDYLEDIRKASDDRLSFVDLLDEFAQFDHTISPKIREDYFHFNVIRGTMTRNIGNRFSGLLDEINKTLGVLLGNVGEDWIDVPCYDTTHKLISRLSARFFVGPELSSNPRYTEIMRAFDTHIVKVGVILSLLPEWLKPIFNRVFFDTEKRMCEVEDYLRPILTQRLEKGMENLDADSNDMITWLWNAAPEANRTLRDIAARMIFVNVGAIQTTSAMLTHVFFNLAAYPSYIEPLRDEISSIIQTDGWNKVSLEKTRKLDSFLKESMRLHGSDAATVVRLVRNDFTFSDGNTIPKGTMVAVAGREINMDESCYPDPETFQGFRFADKDPLKWQMTSLNHDYMAFGVGRHACPGRFFAVTEVKAIVAHILLNYDIKLTDEASGRPKDPWFTGVFVFPNQKAKVSFRKRKIH